MKRLLILALAISSYHAFADTYDAHIFVKDMQTLADIYYDPTITNCYKAIGKSDINMRDMIEYMSSNKETLYKAVGNYPDGRSDLVYMDYLVVFGMMNFYATGDKKAFNQQYCPTNAARKIYYSDFVIEVLAFEAAAADEATHN